MSLGLQATKRRMVSVNSTRKITNAMHLVATAKFKTWKNKMEKSSEFANELKSLFAQVSSSIDKEEFDSFFKSNKKSNKKLYIIITSSLGLCAGYNYNVFKAIKEYVKNEDEVICIGSKGVNYLQNNGYKIDPTFQDIFTHFDYEQVKKLAMCSLSKIRTNQVDEINIIYTQFINSITFTPKVEKLYPLEKLEVEQKEDCTFKDMHALIEPDVKTVLDYIVPLYFESILFGRLVESEVSEQACRRNAMESATDNAEEIISSLQLDYNKARQASITQEITEIVAGANAQK